MVMIGTLRTVLRLGIFAEEAFADRTFLIFRTASEKALVFADMQDRFRVTHRTFDIMRDHDDRDAVIVVDMLQNAV